MKEEDTAMNAISDRILIVEDEESLRKALVTKLSAEGFRTLESANGEEGLRVALDQKPDLILLDILMPKMHGLEMLSQLRHNDWGANIPVIVLSNLNEASKVAEAAEGGVFDYIIKSDWRISDVVDKVRDRLKEAV
ncbi:MAG: response regulator [bacterium]|nr:response regulator [bacterium]